MSGRTGDIFARQFESIHFHVARDEARWAERHADARAADAVIDFGCGVQFVPHLMVETMAVCEALGIDAAGVVGPQYCCGQPYRPDEPGAGENMADNSYKRMASLRPLRMVQWCGAAQVQFAQRAEAAGAETEVLHMTALLARRVQELGPSAPWRGRVEARVLVHRKSQDPMPFPDRGPVMRSYDMIPAMLDRIPGVRVVGEVRELSSFLPCEGGVDALDADGLARARAELAARAREAGADRIIVEHHLCTREWGKLATSDLVVQHYMSILAEALGVAQPDRFHAGWNSPEDRVLRARPQWSTWGLNEDDATAIDARLDRRAKVQPAAGVTRSSQADGRQGSAARLPTRP
jgi:hypothetical protein